MQKRGVSIMVGYVLLVIIAISISILVYNYLEIYVPKEKPECPDGHDVTLIIQSASCQIGSEEDTLSITILNKGLFKVDAVYVRMEAEGRKVKQLVNKEVNGEKDIYIFPESLDYHLNPGEKYDYSTPVTQVVNHISQNYEVEIEPAIIINDQLALCPEFTITQPVTCVVPAT